MTDGRSLLSANAQAHACIQPKPAKTGRQACKTAIKFKSLPSVANSSSYSLNRFAHGCTAHKTRWNNRTVTRAAQQSTGEASTALQPDMTKTKVLFVCKGNICRSPAAQAILKKVVQHSGVADEFEIDSCGTGGSGHGDWYKLDGQGKLGKAAWEEHEDKTVDERMIDALKKRSLDPTSDSRPMEPEDFQRFDFIIAMNQENIEEVHKAGQHWKDEGRKAIPSNWKDKVQLMTKYLVKGEHQEEQEVPDPFHGGPENFEKVLDLLEDACEGFVSHVNSRKFATES